MRSVRKRRRAQMEYTSLDEHTDQTVAMGDASNKRRLLGVKPDRLSPYLCKYEAQFAA